MPVTTNPFPINFIPKVNSPELEAFFAQYGKQSYIDAEDINAFFTALNYLNENIPSVRFIPKGDLLSNTVVTPVANETHIYTAKYSGTKNGVSFKTNDIVAYTTTSSYLFSNNNQKPNEKIYISTAVYNMLPVLTAQKILDTSVSADGYIPVLANKHYEFKLRCHITELSLSNNYLTFKMENSGVIATDFRYTSHSSKNSNAVTPTPEMRLIHNGGTGYTVMNVLSVNSNSRPDMFIDIEGHFRTVTDGNIAPMLQININAAAAKIQPGLYFSIKEITLNN